MRTIGGFGHARRARAHESGVCTAESSVVCLLFAEIRESASSLVKKEPKRGKIKSWSQNPQFEKTSVFSREVFLRSSQSSRGGDELAVEKNERAPEDVAEL